MNAATTETPDAGLKVRRLGIDTYLEPVVFMRSDCHICRSEGFEARSRLKVHVGDKAIIATLNVVHNHLLANDEIGLSESAWDMLTPAAGSLAYFSHPNPLDSLRHVRAKIYGQRLDELALRAVVEDIVGGRYSNTHLAAFIAACGGDHLDRGEIVGLTRAMVEAGDRLSWGGAIVMDKHCIGGIPGNRTTLIVVPIAAAFGLTMPKTSSRAITSPAGTADTMETLAPVVLTPEQMRGVVEREGACIVWGGAVRLSPADDILIRVERQLELDSEGQMVASVLSKKVAAGSNHVLIDLPVGPTAKVRSPEAAWHLAAVFEGVGREMGLSIRSIITDGSQPVGRGIGPALEARDVLAVLQGEPDAPRDLREHALLLAGQLLEQSGRETRGEGRRTAEKILDTGAAWAKFQALCEAQGGMREPPVAPHRHDITAEKNGMVTEIHNRRVALTAKLAGAPDAPAAGVEMHVKVGDPVKRGQPLFTLHAEAKGELSYALDHFRRQPDLIQIVEGD